MRCILLYLFFICCLFGPSKPKLLKPHWNVKQAVNFTRVADFTKNGSIEGFPGTNVSDRNTSLRAYSRNSNISRTPDVVECRVSLNTLKHSVLFLKNNNFWRPDGVEFVISSQDQLIVACPGSEVLLEKAEIPEGKSGFMNAECLGSFDPDKPDVYSFKTINIQYTLDQISCVQKPVIAVESAHPNVCPSGSKLFKVGYNVANQLYTLYEACYDRHHLQTLYVKHHLSKNQLTVQTARNRHQDFRDFTDISLKVRRFYEQEHVANRMATILKKPYKVPDEVKMSKGHLVPRSDFDTVAECDATFHYINAMPQWNRHNDGPWALLETGIAKRVMELDVTLTIYTGTHGVMTFKDSSGRMKPIYLTGKMADKQLPIPLYFYKVVYDPVIESAIAFVSIQNLEYNVKTIKKFTFCENVCAKDPTAYNWLNTRKISDFLRKDSGSFCCTYEDFIKTVTNFPSLIVQQVFK